MKKTIKLIAFLVLGLVFAGCTTESLDIYPNGDSRLRQLVIKNAVLTPEFDPLVSDYYLVMPDRTRVEGVIQPFVFSTRFLVNGQRLVMNTNIYGLPIYTDISSLLVATNVLQVDLTAADGLERTYRVTFLGGDSDAGLGMVGTSSGVIFPAYRDGSAPAFQVVDTATKTTNTTFIEAGATSFNLLVRKNQADSVLTVNGTAAGAGVTNVMHAVTIPGDGSTNTYVLTNISENGHFTNIRFVKAYYQDPDVDTKLVGLSISGAGKAVPLLPRFVFNTKNYKLCLDDIFSLDFSVTKSQSGQQLRVYRNGGLVMSNVAADVSVTLSGVTVAMGDEIRIRVTSPGGVQYAEYVFPITIFTKTPYNFDGNIRNLYLVIDQLTDWDNSGSTPTHPNQPNVIIEGIVTYNYTDSSGVADDSYYIEDGQYGVFVWSYFGKPAGLKLGQKVRIVVEGAKYWFGFAEVTRVEGNVTVLDGGVRYPLHYLDANVVDPGTINTAGTTLRHGARLFKFTPLAGQAVLTGFDESGWGDLDTRLRYKITKPANMDVDELDHNKYPALDYIAEGTYGSIFGPIYYSSSDGYAIEVATVNYLSIP